MMMQPACLTLVTALIAGLMAIPASARDYQRGELSIEHPWSRPTPPGASAGVGYMVITNGSDEDITLLTGATPVAKNVSIHRTSEHEGMMRMQSLDKGLVIPAGETVELKPHSYHLMLDQLSAPLQEGEKIPLTLEFVELGAIEVELAVESMDSAQSDSGHDMEH